MGWSQPVLGGGWSGQGKPVPWGQTEDSCVGASLQSTPAGWPGSHSDYRLTPKNMVPINI